MNAPFTFYQKIRETMLIPRLIISALRGGGGKTLLSLGLCRALRASGTAVKPFKKGPDYIDAHWLELAAKAPCTNLDPYFLEQEQLRALFVHAWQQKAQHVPFPPTLQQQQEPYGLALLEGNRGLFDGQDIYGSCSTAEVARALKAPVILSLDITKMTRTSAALIQGMAHFEKDVHIAAVVLNQVGSARHEKIVRQAIEHYTDIPVLGAIPRLKDNPLPERHMGLCQGHTSQAQDVETILDTLGTTISQYCDVQGLISLAKATQPLPPTPPFWPEKPQSTVTLDTAPKVRIGYIYDTAFWFYYAENLEALARQGAELLPLSILDATPWPQDLDGLYIGGGYPEEFAEEITNSPHLAQIKAFSEQNMPIYAECGGFMLLAQALIRDGNSHTMAQIFPVSTTFFPKPQGLGYVQATVCAENAFHPQGQAVRGHEFHYSQCVTAHPEKLAFCLHLKKGTGMGHVSTQDAEPCTQDRTQHKPVSPNGDGLFVRNTFVSYTHIFAPACPWWAENFVSLAKTWKTQ